MKVDIGSLIHLPHSVPKESVHTADHRVAGFAQIVDGAFHGRRTGAGHGERVSGLGQEKSPELALYFFHQLHETRIEIADRRQAGRLQHTLGDFAGAGA